MKRVLVVSMLIAAAAPAMAQIKGIDKKDMPMKGMETKKDPKGMERLKKDQKVDFEFVQQGKDYMVTGVK